MNALAHTNKTALVEHVIDRMLEGSTLREAIGGCGISIQAFNRLLAKDREAATAYARAAEMRADLLADEIISIADGDGDPAKARNQISARQWLSSKLNSKRYGDRIDLNVTQTLDVSSTLAEARARLLPVRYQQDIEDAQVIDSSSIIEAKPSDKESIAPSSNPQPDIFS